MSAAGEAALEEQARKGRNRRLLIGTGLALLVGVWVLKTPELARDQTAGVVVASAAGLGAVYAFMVPSEAENRWHMHQQGGAGLMVSMRW